MKPVLISLILWASMALTAWAGNYGDPLRPDARIAVLGFSFRDFSTEGAYDGERADQTARIALLDRTLRERLTAKGFDILSNDPILGELAATTNPADCNGCDLRMAGKLGADYVVSGEVHKISNLILTIKLVLREVDSGAMLRGLSVDIRSNTDASWVRGLDYILKYNVFKT